MEDAVLNYFSTQHSMALPILKFCSGLHPEVDFELNVVSILRKWFLLMT